MSFEPIAITGMSTIFPGGKDKRSFWQTIMEGRDCVTEVPPSHWLVEDYYDPDPKATDKIYCSRGGFLPSVPFDAAAFGIPPNTLPAIDVAQILGLIVADRVIADAERHSSTVLDRENSSIFVGFSGATNLISQMSARMARPVWVKAMRESGMPESEIDALCERILENFVPWQENTFPGVLPNLVAGRIANRLDLGGTNCTVDAACGSSLAAIQAGVNELHLGRTSAAIVGSVDTQNSHMGFTCFSKTGVLSPTGDCRPFSADADGTVLAEGAAMVVLRRLADAERDGDRVYAVLRGLGSSSDGRSRSVYAPRPAGQSRALRRAYALAGYGPDTVGLLEAHGTGTDAGDIGEFRAAKKVFEESDSVAHQWCALGTVKSQIGHAKGAAGMAALFRGVMALCHKVLPPTIKVSEPHSRLKIEESPFYLNTESRPWWHSASHPRRVGVSAFGFGGSNFHATLEEYEKSSVRLRTLSAEIVPFAGDSEAGLRARCGEVLELIRGEREPSLQAIAWAQVAKQTQLRGGPPARLALVVASIEELEEQLAAVVAADSLSAASRSPKIYYGEGGAAPKVAFLFPGQASQRLSMGQNLAMAFAPFQEAWASAGALELDGSSTLLDVVFPPPSFDSKAQRAEAERLKDTRWAQPAIGACSMAYLSLLESCGVKPDCLAGHSYGELSALAAGGAIPRDELVRLSRRRGELMASAGSGTGMTAVHADLQAATELLEGTQDVVVANQNGPTQTILSGTVEGLERVEARSQERGIRHTRLQVSAAFHSVHMAVASEGFRAVLVQSQLASSDCPVFRNDGQSQFSEDPQEIAGQVAEQLIQPVFFSDMISRMVESGVDLFVEVGPGQVLTGLLRQIHGDAPGAPRAVSLDSLAGNDLTGFLLGLAELYAAGVDVQLEALWEGYDREELATADAAPKAGYVVQVNGANLGNPYPPAGGAAALPAPQPERPVDPPQPVRPAEHGMVTPVKASPAAGGSLSQEGAVDPDWLAALQAVQEQTVQAQKSFQETMARSHAQFLAAAQQGMEGLLVTAHGRAPAHFAREQVVAPAPAAMSAPMPMPAPSVREAAPLSSPAPPIGHGAIAASEGPSMEEPSKEPPVQGTLTAEELESRVLKVVSESTGYPVDVLDLKTEMEAGLGIDSIKRVEILSQLQEEIPSLNGLDIKDVIGLATLGDIIDFIHGATPSGDSQPEAEASRAASSTVPETDGSRRVPRLVPEGRGTGHGCLEKVERLMLLTSDIGRDRQVAEAMTKILAERGVAVSLGSQVVEGVDGLIVLTGLGQIEKPEQALQIQRDAFQQARSFARQPKRNLFVTVQDTGGRFCHDGACQTRSWMGGLAGLAKTASKEWPQCHVLAIDLEWGDGLPDVMARTLVEELDCLSADLEVGLTATGERYVMREEAIAGEVAEPGGLALGDEAVLIVSGGGRGITTHVLRELAKHRRPRVAILGRTELVDEDPELCDAEDEAALKRGLVQQAQVRGGDADLVAVGHKTQQVMAVREIRQNLEDLASLGLSVSYHRSDLRNAVEVGEAVAEIRERWGRIDGVIHAAGVIADRAIAEKTDEQFDSVFDTKVVGLQNLLAATSSDPLRLLLLFSSVTARYGNAGQCDYAMANEVLNKVAWAQHRERNGECRVKSLGWGPWDGGMVRPELARLLRKKGLPLIRPEQGGRIFCDELFGGDSSDVEVLLLGGRDD